MIGTAGATTTAESALAKTGEGSTKSTAAAKLFGRTTRTSRSSGWPTRPTASTSSRPAWTTAAVISGAVERRPADRRLYNPSSRAPATTRAGPVPGPHQPRADDVAGQPQRLRQLRVPRTPRRCVGSARPGTVITNPDGRSDCSSTVPSPPTATPTRSTRSSTPSSTDGEHWTTPVSVVSTDYTFSASVAQDNALAAGQDTPLGISAYYSGRAYNPTIVPNADGTLTMLFSGYRTPGTRSGRHHRDRNRQLRRVLAVRQRPAPLPDHPGDHPHADLDRPWYHLHNGDLDPGVATVGQPVTYIADRVFDLFRDDRARRR